MEIALLILAVVCIIWMTTRLKMHPFLVLLLVSLAYALLAGMPLEAILAAVNDEFGGTLGKGSLLFWGLSLAHFWSMAVGHGLLPKSTWLKRK